MSRNLSVAVIGAGRMGVDHVQRLARRTHGAEVSAVVDIDPARAAAAAAGVPGAAALTDIRAALEDPRTDAVLIATPGFLHEDALQAALARDIPILCEKPLTPDSVSAWRVLQAEEKLGRKRIQVGFMRRYDAEYAHLAELIRSGELGELLMLHHQHRNPATPPGFSNEMLINDSVVHEFDAVRFFSAEEITSVRVRTGKTTRNAPAGMSDPQQVLMETTSGVLADVEIYVNAQYGYEVGTQAVFEQGVVRIGNDAGPYLSARGRWGGIVLPGFAERFSAAYDREIQSWVDAALQGDIGGPSAWDGYAAAACCEAGVEAQKTGRTVAVELHEKPLLYQS
ncbi:Gfo/Idh/MocA family protein [Arthrobacter sunyaminii]|uniref:Gfo/Idh/MocA family protein n=1 Tax=Arthrobacter sunyaminii TaxID=2816859 RepID=UPI001A941B83|nr:Gfo/Idh/MocA family oxidoreductase [Arthrobacter sunyaminii]MBO0895221.1 Gfo/Idh/MocA family oxidoreductase [Arthrobacter sunyaminii]